jgi:hypothetical protein
MKDVKGLRAGAPRPMRSWAVPVRDVRSAMADWLYL